MRRRSERAGSVAVVATHAAVVHCRSSVGSRCSTRSRSSTQTPPPLRPCADALEHSLLVVDFSECGGSRICLPRSIHIEPAKDDGAARGGAVAALDRGDVVTLPATELLIRRISPRRSASARPGVGHDCVEHRAAQIRPVRQLPSAAVRQRTAARAAGAVRIVDHGGHRGRRRRRAAPPCCWLSPPRRSAARL